VTNAQFARFIAAGGYQNDAWWSAEGRRWRDQPRDYRGQGPLRQPEYWDDPRFNNPLQPVVGVMWYEAQAYTRWLSAMSGREVCLPTDDEWLLAAQGDREREYPWGAGFDSTKANTRESGQGQPTAVGTYPAGASPCGALDMAGNVWEWTASWYDEEKTYRVLRGGSWFNYDYSAGCSFRGRCYPDDSDFNGGFRLVSPVLSSSGY
jgi:formylglycine-generating enzyme required for sulfatase activity